MNASRKILAQGDRDGACFLYAIANSIQSLKDKPVSQRQWGKCIQQLNFNLDDFLAGRGTEKLDDNPIYFELLCKEFLKVLNVKLKIVSHVDISSSADLKRHVLLDSAMLATIYGGAHWVAIVDVNGDDIYMACSAQALSGRSPYREARSPQLNRVFNLKLKFDELDLWKNYGLLISKKPKLS